ncbi:MAG TPA: hypothetical protein VM470_01615 [Acidimicrobiia bacterium]|nr:hypothetical protein [Acidimicrobiia bacterium]
MIHSRASASSLGLLRIYVFAIWSIILLVEGLPALAHLPGAAFRPRGVLMVIPGAVWDVLLSSTGLGVLVAVIVAGTVTVALGLVPSRALALVVAGLLMLEQGLVRGFSGHINHAELVLLYGTLLLPFFPIFDVLSLRHPRRSEAARPVMYQAPFVLFVLIFVVSFSLTGVARLVKGPPLFLSDALRNLTIRDWMESGSVVAGAYAFPAASALLATSLAPLFRLAYFGATMAEVLAPVALFNRQLRLAFVGFALAFHVANLLLLGVTFYENLLLLVLFSQHWFHDLGERLEGSRSTRRPVEATA